MTFFCCYDGNGDVIARCQTIADVEVLRGLGRPVAKVIAMAQEESVVCTLTDSPNAFNLDY
ncbi:MAG: hypothetical protein ERJ67_08485 [Aphanocapsa feldmannii 277cV]|uniref:Uncharacterized protein n=2 Tax=Aphanocapsa feldmannii TaxID=192050 RepID=A0A524RLZ4_9CHRO|nr:MAG: hypothetical protein ERJ69_04215 [Aphanocapsa feldmannii 288cV]TGG91175.1 MAG: hypothetical protein ERJ67_08485 [Aphanocapsa feldmannii 277cV]TGH21211.1 MAG: hypothetical protein ERJ68_05730 [Aphanocapsa feldmannii 277cI]